MARHVDDCMVITMAQTTVPGFEVWCSGCVEGGGFSWICRCNGMVVGASVIHIMGYIVKCIKQHCFQTVLVIMIVPSGPMTQHDLASK